MAKVFLLTGMPGVKKTGIAGKLIQYLQSEEGGGISSCHANVEDELIDLFKKNESNIGQGVYHPLVAIIGCKSQELIRSKWRQAFESAVERASRHNADVAIVSACLEYYCWETNEFFSPVDLEIVSKYKPLNVLTLIDDAFEVYHKLSLKGQVFDIVKLQELYFPTGSRPDKTKNDLRSLYKDALNLVIENILRVLVWREKEIEAGTNLSRTMTECDHTVLAAKHPVSSGVRFLLGRCSEEFGLGKIYPVYVSHPISRSREDRAIHGKWPSFVSHLAECCESIGSESINSCHVVPIMPTTIDEFRLMSDGTFFLPCLSPRWPLSSAELMYSIPELDNSGTGGNREYDEYERQELSVIFDPPIDESGRRIGFPLSDNEISGMLRTLMASIRLQMAGRDHLMVRQCPGLFLYRPTFGEHKFSRGVEAELRTFTKVRDYYSEEKTSGSDRRVAFVHDFVDMKCFFGRTKENEYQSYIEEAASNIRQEAEKVAKEHDMKKVPSLPDSTVVSHALGSLCDNGTNQEELFRALFNKNSPPRGHLGSEIPMEFQSMELPLRIILNDERLKALSSNVAPSGKREYEYSYLVSGGLIESERSSKDAVSSDTFVIVADKLDSDGNQRDSVVTRARQYFANPSE